MKTFPFLIALLIPFNMVAQPIQTKVIENQTVADNMNIRSCVRDVAYYAIDDGTDVQSVSQAQGAVKFTIVDEDSGEPVPFASVAIKQGETIMAGGASDFDGLCHIEPIMPGEYDVQISSLGYESVIITHVRIIGNKTTHLPEQSLQSAAVFITHCYSSCYRNYPVETHAKARPARLREVRFLITEEGTDFEIFQAKISLINSDGEVLEGLTEGDGYADVSGVGETERYTLKIDAVGYEPLEIEKFKVPRKGLFTKVYAYELERASIMLSEFELIEYTSPLICATGCYCGMRYERITSSVPDGFEELASSSSALLYPNPTRSQFKVLSDAPVQQLEVYTMSGQQCLKAEGNMQNTFEVSALPAGSYIVRWVSDGVSYQSRLIRL